MSTSSAVRGGRTRPPNGRSAGLESDGSISRGKRPTSDERFVPLESSRSFKVK